MCEKSICPAQWSYVRMQPRSCKNTPKIKEWSYNKVKTKLGTEISNKSSNLMPRKIWSYYIKAMSNKTRKYGAKSELLRANILFQWHVIKNTKQLITRILVK